MHVCTDAIRVTFLPTRRARRTACALAALIVIAAAMVGSFLGSDPTPVRAQGNELSVRTISLQTKDLVFDWTRGYLYASVPSTGEHASNGVAAIDPVTLSVHSLARLGGEPGKLVLSDEDEYLYIAQDGIAQVSRINLATRLVDQRFSIGAGPRGSYRVEDMEVQTDSPHVLAISRRHPSGSPRHADVAIYDDGALRPTTASGHVGSNVIEFGADPSLLFGYDNQTSAAGFYTMIVSSDGVAITGSESIFSGSNEDIEYDTGRMYTTNGFIIDPENRRVIGSFPARGIVEPDTENAVIYFLSDTFEHDIKLLRVFDIHSRLLIGEFEIRGVPGKAEDLVSWSNAGLAFRTDQGKVFLLHFGELPPAPNPCTFHRPAVSVAVAPNGSGKLRVTVRAGAFSSGTIENQISTIRVGSFNHGLIQLPGQNPAPGGFTYPVSPPRPEVTFDIQRTTSGAAITVPLVVTDRCGEWRTFVGGGPNAF